MLVSVVIPTHNRRALVREAVGSVLEQRGAAFEVVVVDDGSTDGTAGALRGEFGTAVTVIETANRGVSAARNLGVRQGHGDLVAFLDSDDLWLPGKLAAQVACFDDDRVSFCHTQEVWLRDGRRVVPSAQQRKPHGRILLPSLRRCLVGASTVMMRRALFERKGGFDESLPACEDYDLWLRVSVDTEAHLVDRALVVHRAGHADQLSRRYWGMDRFRVSALAKLLASHTLLANERKEAASVLSEKCSILATGAARRGKRSEADAYLALARSHV